MLDQPEKGEKGTGALADLNQGGEPTSTSFFYLSCPKPVCSKFFEAAAK